MMWVVLAPLLLQARVGENLKQSETRYGTGEELQDAETFILKNARNVVYFHGDWIITAGYLNNVTARIQYEKAGLRQPRAQLTREDVAEILEAEDAAGWSAYNEETRQAGKAYTGKTHPPPVLRSVSGLTARYKVFSVTVEREEASHHEKGTTLRQPLRPTLTPRGKRVAL
ncbi:MAG TPA: hypothetical protein P5125_01765 [Kiritimatiellia bacterium]|nr:hypothetical protein [Kiritimatiellia bacterium]HRU19058.1 hypothetical protein [Kiritimatiellia bacterium]